MFCYDTAYCGFQSNKHQTSWAAEASPRFMPLLTTAGSPGDSTGMNLAGWFSA